MKRLIGNPRGAHLGDNLLSAYLDGQVTADERRRIDLHLGSCATCQRNLASLRGTVILLHAMPRMAVPRAFTLAEAQVGVRRPAGQPAWLGGLLRGLAAVSAVALVAVAAAVLVKPLAEPAQEMARVAAPAAAPAPAASQALPEVTRSQAAAPANTAAMPTAPKEQAVAKAPAPTAAPTAAEKAGATLLPATKAAAPTEATASQVEKTAATAPSVPPSAPAAAPPPAGERTAAPTAAPAVLAAPATALPTPSLARSAPDAGIATAAGKSAGGPALATPVLTPAFALAALPAEAALVYADDAGLWAVDHRSGARSLVAGQGVTRPAISDDRTRVAYRQTRDGATDVWTVAWTGGAPKLLLSERDLNTGLPPGIRQRRIQDVRWLPGKPLLAVTALAQPAATDGVASLELWRVDVATGQRRLLASGDSRHQPVPAPNGNHVAFFRREPDKAAEGSLWLVGADGGDERAVLRFPMRPDQRAYPEQISWLPDSSAFWAAIPDTDLGRPEPPNGLTLYRVPVQGEAQPMGRADAQQAYWSPDAKRLVYVRLADNAKPSREFFAAEADGANPQLQAAVENGQFVSWSPDSARYLYEDNGQLLAMMSDQQPQPIAVGAVEPQWLSPDQVLYVANQDGANRLIYATIGGPAVPLQALSADATFDARLP